MIHVTLATICGTGPPGKRLRPHADLLDERSGLRRNATDGARERRRPDRKPVRREANAVLLATALGLGGLFAVGAALSLFTGRNTLWSGSRMVLIGGSAALTTYLIGKWLGVSLS